MNTFSVQCVSEDGDTVIVPGEASVSEVEI